MKRYLLLFLLLCGLTCGADVSVYNLPIANPYSLPANVTFTTLQLNSVGEGSETKAGSVFIAPIAGATSKITKAGFRITAVTGTPATYRVSLQGVTAATGLPDGTIKSGTGSNDVYVDVDPSATGWSGWLTLGGGGYSPTQGEALAVVVAPVDDPSSANVTVAYGYTIQASVSLSPFGVVMAAGTWAISTKPPMIGVQYANGVVPNGILCISAGTDQAWSTSNAPLYRGIKWTPPLTCRLVGAYVWMRPAAGSDFALELFSDKTEVLSVDVDVSQVLSSVGGNYLIYVPFTPTTLTANSVYRILVQPATTTAFTSFLAWTFPDAASLRSMYGSLYGTTLTSDKATAVDYDNASDGYRFYGVIPVIDQITLSAGGGMGFSGGFQ
jgi:hypothetical protein